MIIIPEADRALLILVDLAQNLAQPAVPEVNLERRNPFARQTYTCAPHHAFAQRRVVTLTDAAREPCVTVTRDEFPNYHARLSAIFVRPKIKPRIVDEHDSISGMISSVEAGIGVTMLAESSGYSARIINRSIMTVSFRE